MRKSDSLKWVQQEDYSAIRLPFAGESLGLVIVLPKTPVGLDSVVRSLDHDRQNALFDSIQRESARAVEIRLPKFKASFKASLSEIFETEGMHLALSDGADFSGMTVPSGRPLEIGAILHRAVIELAEEGVEAAAATAVGIVATASIERLPEPFVVDRPFLFFVVDDATGAVLFEGRIVDPTKST
jgi:serpin B